MNITLIFAARYNEPIRAIIHTPPAGINILAAMVPPESRVKVIDMLAGDRVSFEEKTDLVGISVRTPIANIAYKIADNYKKRGVAVVLGGPHASALPLDAARHADAVVVGEAETTWPNLLEDFRNNKLKKFYVSGPLRFDLGEEPIYHVPEFPPLENIPIQRRDILPQRRYKMDTIFTTRGCPHQCVFCPVPTQFGKKLRHRPIDDVVREVDTLKSRYFNLDDNIFGIPGEEDYYIDLFSKLTELKRKRLWLGQAGLSVLESPKGLDILKKAVGCGLASVSIGIESISKDGLIESGAGKKISTSTVDQSLKKTKEKIKLLQNHGVFVAGWFVIGWDSDDKGAYAKSLEFAEQTGIAPVITNLAPLPGTRCYNDFLKSGKLKSNSTWDDYGIADNRIAFIHPSISEEDMISCRKDAMARGYSFKNRLTRSINFSKGHLGVKGFVLSMLSQRGMKRAFGG